MLNISQLLKYSCTITVYRYDRHGTCDLTYGAERCSNNKRTWSGTRKRWTSVQRSRGCLKQKTALHCCNHSPAGTVYYLARKDCTCYQRAIASKHIVAMDSIAVDHSRELCRGRQASRINGDLQTKIRDQRHMVNPNIMYDSRRAACRMLYSINGCLSAVIMESLQCSYLCVYYQGHQSCAALCCAVQR
jgi:hypothetical protein